MISKNNAPALPIIGNFALQVYETIQLGSVTPKKSPSAFADGLFLWGNK